MQSTGDSPSRMQQFSGSPQEIQLPERRARVSVETPFAHEFSIELSGALDSMDSVGPSHEDMVHFDPEVLASLVVQLRSNMASAIRERDEMRGERDDLIRDLAITQTRLQDLEGSQEREVQLLNEMVSWRKRCEDAEEQIVMLRQKVEESRRAVMTLQTQSRRLSQLSLGYGYSGPSPHGSPHAQTFGGPSAAASATAAAGDAATKTSPYQKRMSLQVGSPGNVAARARHRRQTSLSEPSIDATSLESESSHAQSAQTDASSQDQDQITAAARNTLSRTGSRRQSTVHSRPTESLLNPYAAEMEALRQELIGVRVELIDTKRELWETNEAKEASDVCLKALKKFIAENSIGDAPQSTTTAANTAGSSSSPLRGISLPPLPTDNIDHLGDDEDENRTPIATHAHSNSGATTKRGWGLGFWGISSNPAPDVSASSSTVKVSSSGHDSVSHSSSPPASTNTKSPMIPVGSISSLVSKWRRTENGSTSSSSSSPSISSVHTTAISDSPTSPPVGESPTAAHSTKSSIASAFRWPSQVQAKPTSEAPTTDNYTPAPRPGSLKKRPSAYSSVVNRTPSGPNRKETVMTIFSYDQHESIQPYSEDDELSPLSLDSTLTTTPPLTDTEGAGTNPSTSGSDREPDSPVSDHGFSLQARISSSESIHQSTSTLEVHKEEVTAITTSIPIHLSPRPPPLSPGIQMAHSPATLSPKVMGGTLGVEGRPRARSRAASNAVMMERIDEVAVASTGGEAFVAVRL